jgi:hypothetical protein
VVEVESRTMFTIEDGRYLEVKTGDDGLLIGGRGRRRVDRA